MNATPETTPDVPMPTIRPAVQLSGNDGNAFAIMGACARAGRRAGWSRPQIEAFKTECKSGDYDHLLQTAMTWCNVDGDEDETVAYEHGDDEDWLDI